MQKLESKSSESRKLGLQSAELWKKLGEDRELLITADGKPAALLADVSGETEETVKELIRALRRARARIAVDEMRRISVGLGNDRLSLEEINAIIRSAREQQASSESF